MLSYRELYMSYLQLRLLCQVCNSSPRKHRCARRKTGSDDHLSPGLPLLYQASMIKSFLFLNKEMETAVSKHLKSASTLDK